MYMLAPFRVAVMRPEWYAWLLSGSSQLSVFWEIAPLFQVSMAQLSASVVSLLLIVTCLPSELTSRPPKSQSTGYHMVIASPYAWPTLTAIGGRFLLLSCLPLAASSSHVEKKLVRPACCHRSVR